MTEGASTAQEGAASVAPALPEATPQAAQAARAALMANADFRRAAMDAASPQWAELSRLNALIAPVDDNEDDGVPTPAAVKKPEAVADEDDESEIPEGAFDPPRSPHDYRLTAKPGVEIDPAVDAALRQGLHAAGVDQSLADMLTFVTDAAPGVPPSEAQIDSDYHGAALSLQSKWGPVFDERVAIANAYGRELFEALPEAITQGQTYREYCVKAGLANNSAIVQQLYERAAHRARNR